MAETVRNFDVDLHGVTLPVRDGEVLDFTHPEAAASKWFDARRRVLFVNGMDNSAQAHAESALQLSLVQMCRVRGIYNKTAGVALDLAQCLGDKWQFNGPVAPGVKTQIALGKLFVRDQSREQLVVAALGRNPAAVSVFEELRARPGRRVEIFAHSQGNLILSNALQAIAALDGDRAVAQITVHSFGSPAVRWPRGVRRLDHAFTWDPVSWLAGLDPSLSISKVGMPQDSLQPITHAFLEYMKSDPVFVVNRFRIGGLGVTFSMDEDGLARCLVAMGANLPRVRLVFEHLAAHHASDVDDVAELYVAGVQKSPTRAALEAALRGDNALRQLLIRVLEEGWTTGGERAAIDWLRGL